MGSRAASASVRLNPGFGMVNRNQGTTIFFLSFSLLDIEKNNPRGLSQITLALGVGRWSEKCVVCYIKSAI